MTKDKTLIEHARSDIAYVDGLTAHLEHSQCSDKNISDLIAMVRWNAEQYIYAKMTIEAQAADIARLRSLMSWVQSCDGIGTFRKGDCRDVVMSFDNSEAGMAAFEAISEFIEAAHQALGEQL